MTDAREILPGPAAGIGPVPANPSGRKGAGAAKDAASEFEAVMTRLRPEPIRKDGESGPARVPSRSGLAGAALLPDAEVIAADGTAESGPAVEMRAEPPAMVDPGELGSQGQVLARGVGDRIAAFLGADRPAGERDAVVSPGPAGGGRSHAGWATDAAARTSLATGRRTAGADGEGTSFELSVRRRETHLGPPSRGDGAFFSARAEGALAGREAKDRLGTGKAEISSAAPELSGALRGREQQVLIAARAGRDHGAAMPAKTEAASPQAAVRGGSEQIRPAGELEQAGAGVTRDAGPEPLAGGQAGAAPSRSAEAGTSPLVSATPASVSSSQVVVGSGPVKMLQIQLQPAELGMLQVSMRLTDAGLEVHIEAGRRETYALLKSDREVLSTVLRAAGHSLETVTVAFSDRGGAPAQGSSQDGAQGFGWGARHEAQSGAARDEGGGSADRLPSRPGDEASSEQGQHDQDRPALAARHHGDVYL